MTRGDDEPGAETAGFRMTRLFKAPRHLVFEMWTDPRLVAQWWGVAGSTVSACELDVRPGGRWRIDMRIADGTVFPNGGVYLEVIPNELIVYSDVADPASPAWDGAPRGDVIHTVTFEDAAGMTKVSLESRFSSAADYERLVRSGIMNGIGQSLDRLERLLAATA